MEVTDYVLGLKQRLPTGDVWPTSDETDGTTAWDALLEALAQEPARVDADALALIEKVIPDNDDTDLEAWEEALGAPDENLSDDERLARIRAILRQRGELDRATLEAVIQKLAGDDAGVSLFNRAYPPDMGAGNTVAGGGCSGTALQPYLWLCELWPNVLTAAPDAFSVWTGFTSVSDYIIESPVTLTETAALVTLGAGGASRAFAAADDETAYASIWVWLDPAASVAFGLYRRSGGAPVYTTFADLTPLRWHRLTYEGSVGAGGADPAVVIAAAPSTNMRLSWCVVGVRNAKLESAVTALMPMHTRGKFGVQGEYATILSHDPEEIYI